MNFTSHPDGGGELIGYEVAGKFYHPDDVTIVRVSPPAPPPPAPDLDAIGWIEDPWHGPSRPPRLSCWLIFWRPCPHKVQQVRAGA